MKRRLQSPTLAERFHSLEIPVHVYLHKQYTYVLPVKKTKARKLKIGNNKLAHNLIQQFLRKKVFTKDFVDKVRSPRNEPDEPQSPVQGDT